MLRHLLLSKEAKGKDRGFISYAELGINQLGAVYEGLMSYTGFFADEDLYEVAKNGDASKGSWVVPVEPASRASPEATSSAPRTRSPASDKPVVHRRGTFVYRLAGRERQQSASYYTPEVLTRFTSSQALEELLDQDGARTTAEEILDLTVCEPALGSGAFAIEAVRQLAEQYLRRRQDELGERIDPDEYPPNCSGSRPTIALHQVYGVDLNATAVEFAEISLWLATMVSGLQAPWFGLRLRRGNSLIGARRAVYTRAAVNDKSWLKATPADVPLTGMVEEMATARPPGRPTAASTTSCCPPSGWGSAVEAKEAIGLAPEAAAALKEWRSVDRRASRARSRSTRSSNWRTGSSRCGSSRCAGSRSPRQRPAATSRSGAGTSRSTRQAVTREQIEADTHRPERRLPAAAAGDGRLGRPVVLAAHRHRAASIAAHPRPVDRRLPAAPRPRARGAQEQQWHDDAAATASELGRPERRRGTQPRLRRAQ